MHPLKLCSRYLLFKLILRHDTSFATQKMPKPHPNVDKAQ
jgi:hypothetical protein